nr:MAG TPA: hypothetical protein [Caudoviricetes sp.]DAR57119.1 MAG TPA: hypothetical protein [Caudoviricetes sp.]
MRIASHSSFGGIPQNFKAIILYGKGTTIFLNSKDFNKSPIKGLFHYTSIEYIKRLSNPNNR